MFLPIHITIALASIVLATYAYVAPSVNRLRASYALIALTVISGTYLILSSPAHMLQACVSGVLYVSVVTVAIVFAHRKLATAK